MGRRIVRNVDIVYNTTLVCPWDCKICCVDAVHVTKKNNEIVLRSKGLQKTEVLPLSHGESIYDTALLERQKRGAELTLQQKVAVLHNLRGFDVKLDISGGDPLSVTENRTFLRVASEFLGKVNITVTSTWRGLQSEVFDEVASLIGELNFTYDFKKDDHSAGRPSGYARGNLVTADCLRSKGCRTRAELPLTKSFTNQDLRDIYLELHSAGIETLLLMRLFPVGRGAHYRQEVPTVVQYSESIAYLRQMESHLKTPVLKLQCALKHLEKPTRQNPCDLVRESFGLMADGTLLASPWALDAHGMPLTQDWVLGNLATTPLSDILASDHAQAFLSRADENHGHCKVFAFLSSNKDEFFERLFDVSDPLYNSSMR